MKVHMEARHEHLYYRLVFHVSGAIGYFVGIGTWLFTLVGNPR